MSYLDFNICKKIDTLAGTSIGGILAMTYAMTDKYKLVNNIFKIMGPDIFSKRNLFGMIRGPRYKNNNLKKLLKKFFGDKKLSNIKNINLIITSTDYTLRQPRIFENIKLKPEQDVSLIDIGLCTSAAPTYFDAQDIAWRTLKYDLNNIPMNEKTLLLAAFEKDKLMKDPSFKRSSVIFDGGVLENIPIISTYTTLHNEYGIEPKDIDMFVIGTGNLITQLNYTAKDVNKWSVVTLLTKFLIPYITDANEQTSIFWGLQMGFNSFSYFNPVKISGPMDDPNIMNDIMEQCLNNKDKFIKEINEFLNK